MTNPQILVRFVPSWEVEPELTKQVEKTEWIAWEGGIIPVPINESVFVRFRNGSEFFGKRAGTFLWMHKNTSFDIVAYKVTHD